MWFDGKPGTVSVNTERKAAALLQHRRVAPLCPGAYVVCSGHPYLVLLGNPAVTLTRLGIADADPSTPPCTCQHWDFGTDTACSHLTAAQTHQALTGPLERRTR